jgi:Na+/citrate or Na+/malate symporter
VKAFVGIVLLAIGVVFTDLGEVAQSITPHYVFLCAIVVIGAVLGAGLVGRLVGFYFIESALTAGLCMTNMGGTGDVAVLSAAKRMQLMPFARLSTSIGGALIIFLCGLLASYMQGAR